MRILIAALLTFVVSAAPAAAQGQWEVEFHAGGLLSNNPQSGTAAMPAAGTVFTTATGQLSRIESSWYFGDGAVLLNQVYAARGLSTRITALDPMLTSASTERQDAASIGFRVSRHIASRYTAELSVDYARSRLAFGDAALAGIEASRATFASAFSVPLPAGAGGNTPSLTATSTSAIDQPRSHQVFATGVLTIDLKAAGKIVPYAAIGGGIRVNGGKSPTVALLGHYLIGAPPGAQNAGLVRHDETDSVNLHYSIERRAFVGEFGGGIKYLASPHWGLRFDVRAHVSRNRVSTLVDAKPTVATLAPAALTIATNPAIQFSSDPSMGRSSLSGSTITGFETFAGTGTQLQVSIVPGVFWRF